ncbi:hypothetical protein BGZ91_002466 [Linnemannia elongata]|nr:hypothetical protein BGZ91_002466 [Linnemannia elongata]
MSTIDWTGNFPFDRLEQRMNQVFDQLINPRSTFRHGQCSSSGDNQLATKNLINPAVTVYETDKDWNVHVEHPGVKKKDIKIDARDSALSREQGHRFGAFMRTIPLPDHVDRDNIDANFKGGVLSLFLPKGEAVQARRLPSLK